MELLESLKTPGYTLLQNADGEEARGVRRADELAGDSSNTVFIIASEDDALLHNIVEGVRPLLSR